MKGKIIVSIMLISLLLFLGCTQPPAPPTGEGKGTLVLKVTDKKIEGLEALNITVSGIELHKADDDGNWIVFSEEEQTFDLVQLHHVTDVLGETELDEGKYTQIRLDITDAEATIDGEVVSVMVPSDKLKLTHNFDIVADAETELILDFSLESLTQANDKYILNPVVKILTPKEFEEKVKKEKEEEEKESEVEFESIEQGYYSGYTEAENIVIKDNEEYGAVWGQIYSGSTPPTPPPTVDFSTHMVIAVFMGEFNTGGYSIEVTKITESKNKIIVYVTKTHPSPEDNVTLALSQPYHIVKTALSEKNVSFKIKEIKPEEEELCGNDTVDEGEDCYTCPEDLPEADCEAEVEGEGELSIYLTDPPQNKDTNYSSLNITISRIEVHRTASTDEGRKWYVFMEEEKTFDLIQLENVQELLGEKTLDAGKYTQIRLDVTKATVTLADVNCVDSNSVDGNSTDSNCIYDVKVPSERLYLTHQFTVGADQETQLLIDFKRESVKKAGDKYIMTPVIKVTTLKEPEEEEPEIECDSENPCDENKLCCNNECIVPECVVDTDCDDTNESTTDTCNNPNTCDAECENELIEELCGNEVIDTGENCSNCPADVVCDTNQLCCNEECIVPECTVDTDCDDGDETTVDACLDANTCDALCSNTYEGQLKEFDVNADVNGFVPNEFTVRKSDTLKLNITSLDTNHNITIPDFNINTELPLAETITVEFVVDQNGTFSFHCSYHPTMTGTITVTE